MSVILGRLSLDEKQVESAILILTRGFLKEYSFIKPYLLMSLPRTLLSKNFTQGQKDGLWAQWLNHFVGMLHVGSEHKPSLGFALRVFDNVLREAPELTSAFPLKVFNQTIASVYEKLGYEDEAIRRDANIMYRLLILDKLTTQQRECLVQLENPLSVEKTIFLSLLAIHQQNEILVEPTNVSSSQQRYFFFDTEPLEKEKEPTAPSVSPQKDG